MLLFSLFALLIYSEAPKVQRPILKADVHQGQFLQVQLRFDRKAAPQNVAVSLGKDTAVPCYPDEASGDQQLWSTYLAVPADANIGTGEVNILVEGKPDSKAAVIVKETRFPVIALKLSKETKALYELPGREAELKKIRGALKTESAGRLWKAPFAEPVKGQPNSPYGEKRSIDGKPKPGYHRGADIEAPHGEPIFSINHGRVLLAAPFIEEGNMVMVDHGQGLISAYLHMSKITVKEGQMVKAGEKVGEVGNTGISTSPHLHLGIYLHSTPIDPLYWLYEFSRQPPKAPR